MARNPHLALPRPPPPRPPAAHSPPRDDGSTLLMKVPTNVVGGIIGKGGEVIKGLQAKSGAYIRVQRETDATPGAPDREVYIQGDPAAVAMAKQSVFEGRRVGGVGWGEGEGTVCQPARPAVRGCTSQPRQHTHLSGFFCRPTPCAACTQPCEL
jgi:hypothetical protein